MQTQMLVSPRSPLARRSEIARLIEESLLDGMRDEIYAMQDAAAHEGQPIAAVSCLVRDLPRSGPLDVSDVEIERALASLGEW